MTLRDKVIEERMQFLFAVFELEDVRANVTGCYGEEVVRCLDVVHQCLLAEATILYCC